MKLKFWAVLTGFMALLCGCDDTTTGIGEFVAEGDEIHAFSDSYNVTTGTVLLDSVYSRTGTAYLGKFTDGQYGEFSAGFIAQINCPANFELPTTFQKLEGITLRLAYPKYASGYFGDSLSVLRVRVDSLDTVIDDNGKNKDLYYTSLDPTRYYNEKESPLVEKDYSAYDMALNDSIRNLRSFSSIEIPLGKSFVDYFNAKYVENDHQNFKDASTFINNVLKGFYVHTSQGEGSILYINDIALVLDFAYTTKTTAGKDSVIHGVALMPATKEVFTSTTFKNSSKLEELVKDESQTYLKTPAGLCTEIQLPIEAMYADHSTDTLNSITLTLTKFREDDIANPYKMGSPSRLLLVRKNEAKAFFENNEVNNNKTSFLTSYSSTYNTYTFSSLNRLISQIFSEVRNGKPKVEGWDKVLLIPVETETTTTTSGQEQVLSVSHDMKVNSAKLRKGTSSDGNIKLEVIYTHPQTHKR